MMNPREHASELSQVDALHPRSAAFLASVMEQSPHSMWISDERGTLLWMNQACRDLLRITDEDVVGKYNVLQDNIVLEQGYMPLVQQVFDTGQKARFILEYDSSQLRYLELDETIVATLDVTISAVMDGNGSVTNAIVQHIDITDRMLAEGLLRIQRDLATRLVAVGSLSEALDLALDALLQIPGIDSGGIYLVNQEEGGLELAVHRDLTDTFVDQVRYYGPDSPQAGIVMAGVPAYYDQRGILELAGDVAAEESLCSLAVLPISSDTRPAQETPVGSLNLSSHRLGQIPPSIRDTLEAISLQVGSSITRLEAEKALREAEGRFRGLFDQSPVGMVIYGLDGRIVYGNSALRELYGLSEQAYRLLQAKYNILADEQLQTKEVLAELQRAFAGEAVSLPLIRYDPGPEEEDAKAIWADSYAYPVRNTQGLVQEVVLVQSDVTARVQAESELERNREQLEEIVAERTRELRTLVNAMAGREVRMAELKETIRTLRNQLGQAGIEPVADDPLLAGQDA